jgi:hypothetical protein
MINPFDKIPIFTCSTRTLLERPEPPPAPTRTFRARFPGEDGNPGQGRSYIEGVGAFDHAGVTELVIAERRELATAMINWWRAWGGLS